MTESPARTTTRRSPRTAAVALSLALAGSLGLAACGSDEGTRASSAPSTSPVASASTEPAAAIDGLTGVETSVALEQSFLDALSSLGVTPGTIGNATLEDGSIAFPITGGAVTYYDPASGVSPFVQGTILHAGSGLSLTAGDTTVELTNFVVDPGESLLFGSVAVNGQVAAPSAPLFFLDGRTLEALQTQDGTASLAGTQVKLHPTAAGLLRETFMTEGVPDYLPIGTATITLALPSS